MPTIELSDEDALYLAFLLADRRPMLLGVGADPRAMKALANEDRIAHAVARVRVRMADFQSEGGAQ